MSEIRKRPTGSSTPKLPKGAEAAIWSILEPIPDPRNHLALTRDPTGEVHITELDRALAAAVAEPIIDVREIVDSYYDLGTLEENAPLTNEFFSGMLSPSDEPAPMSSTADA